MPEMFPTTVNICIAAILLCSTGFASSKTCWTATWYNNNHPTSTNRNDVEPLPSNADLNKVCPQGLTTLAVQCKDNKGEPFAGTRNMTCGQAASYLTVTCDAQGGLNCTSHGDVSCQCPDFSIQYGCDCQTRPQERVTTPPPISVTTNPPAVAIGRK